jgi:hypothetical protein
MASFCITAVVPATGRRADGERRYGLPGLQDGDWITSIEGTWVPELKAQGMRTIRYG